MNVLSLFDGMGCGAIALRELGINVDKYYASEIDKFAIMQTQLNFPNTIQLGSVLKINTKTLCISEVYSYICEKYFKYGIQDLQSIISEWEMLHRINEEQTFAAYFGAQVENEICKTSENPILSINDRVWFFRNKMGDNKGIYDVIRCGERRKNANCIDVGELCKYSFWWNGYGQQKPETSNESIEWLNGADCNKGNKEKIKGKCNKTIFNKGVKRPSEGESVRTIQRPNKKNELSKWNSKNRYACENCEKEKYGKIKEGGSIQKIKRKLQANDDNDGAFKNYRDFLFLCEKIQVTIVECEWGVIIYKGIFHITLGGSPCQSFSFAGKRNGMTTTENEEIYTLERYLELKSEGFQFEGQSYLFWEYMRILTDIRKYNPDVKFLLENVEMGDKWERILSEAIGIFGVHINSALVSAQNRKRIYWTNIRVKEVGLFGELHSDIPQPKDEGILLKDILEEEVDEKYYLSEKGLAGMLKHKENNTNNGNGFGVQFITRETEKSNSILQRGYKDCKDNAVCVAMRGRNPNNPSDRTSGSPTEQRLEPNLNGKTNTITTVQKDNLVLQIKEATSKGYAEINPGECFDMEQPNSNTRRERKMDYKSNSLMAQNMSFMNYTKDYRIRRLTPTEASRLQTIPEWYEWIVSETQQYKMLGNGWNSKTIMHILQYLNNN